jgi:4-phospho-D-threonate 3-dehydrogenase / 4-phospho-D-erythronate 3-dehydrogenase
MTSAPARIGITLGDPAGVGPEITCKALAQTTPELRSATLVFGDPEIVERANRLTGAGLKFSTHPANGDVGLVAVAAPDPKGIQDGRMSAAGGAAAYAAIERAVQASMAGEIGCIVTAPINKEALHAAGYHYSGHTELLAHLSGAKSSFMLLASEKLSTIHVSTHVSLADAVKRATVAREYDTIRAGHDVFRRMGWERPRIAVAGLNPHCGENGLFGTQESEFIAPAIERARAEGIDVKGPLPGDSVFYRATQGEFDLVVAQYHDQGHIPTKLIAFDSTVNISVGLPIQRTSVDHGTAFDIAWRGVAKHVNMIAAIDYARRLAAHAVAVH